MSKIILLVICCGIIGVSAQSNDSIKISCNLTFPDSRCKFKNVTIGADDEIKFEVTSSEYFNHDDDLDNKTKLELKKYYHGHVENFVEQIAFENSEIDAIPASLFSKFVYLKILQVIGQHLSQIKPETFSNAKSLFKLDLIYHKIETLYGDSFKGLGNMVMLNMNGGLLKKIEVGAFDDLYKLEYLYLSNNKIESLPPAIFKDLRNLRNLLLNRNSITALDGNLFANIQELQVLDLSDNSLKVLPENIFNNNLQLNIIDLSRCKLEKIPDHSFYNNLKLMELYLKYNVCINQEFVDSKRDKIWKALSETCENSTEH
jgi:hypothetical protein